MLRVFVFAPLVTELAGILSRGSEQSRQFSQDQGVPLCTEIDDLPEQ